MTQGHERDFTPQDFTPEESKKIEELHGQRDELFSEIALIIAFRLGYSTDKVEDLAKLSDQERASLEADTEEAIENWDHANIEGVLEPTAPTDPLQALLAKHHELGEQILDIQDLAASGRAEMTDDDIHALIIDLIESHVDEENRELVLDWVMARRVSFDFMVDWGIVTPDDWANIGLKTTK